MKSNLLLAFFITFSIFLGITIQSQSQVPSYVPTNGLVGWWPFNGNANNEFNTNEVSVINGATLTTDRFGLEGRAYSFDGISNDIVTGNYGVSGTGISVSFWYKTSQITEGNYMICWGGNGWASFFEILNNHWSAQTVGPCYTPALTAGGTLISKGISVLPNADMWHHCVVILPLGAQSLNEAKFYFDNLQLTETCSYANYGAGNPNISTNNLIKFGNGYQGWANHFEGNLDDIGIWNRELTPQEIADLFIVCNVTPQIIAGNATPSAFANSTYTCNNTAGSTYSWSVNNGVIVSGQGTNSITVLWGAEGVGSVTVAETATDGCVGDAVVFDVNVQCVVSGTSITGPVGPETFSNSTYTCNGAVNSAYQWTITNGVIVSGQGTNTVNVLWASTGIGDVSVVETTAEGCVGTTLSQDVVVIPTNVEELSNAFIVYPNPVTTELKLQTTTELIGKDLVIFDALGKQIMKQQILSTNTTINTSSFAAGNYVVKIGEGVKRFEVIK